jgi:pyrroline-5-carboxylate reductase
VIVAARLIGFVTAHQNLRAVVVGRMTIDDALRIDRAATAFSAVGCHPHAAVFREQRKVRSGAERFSAKVECEPGSQHIIAIFQQVPDELEEAGIAGEELHFVEGNDLEAAACHGFLSAQNRPDFIGVRGQDLLCGILITTTTFDTAQAAACVGPRLEDSNLLVAVTTQSVDLREKMPGLARSHISNKQSEDPAARQVVISTVTIATMSTSQGLLESGRTLGVIGAGVMGRTLIKGLLDAGLVSRRQIWVTAKTQASCEEAAESLGITGVKDYRESAETAGIILVCVKPAQIGTVSAVLKQASLRPDTVLISILAGVSTERLESLLPGDHVWVRAIPNTPCVVGQGMTAICGGSGVTPEHLTLAERIFSSVGRCAVVEEHYCNAITALSGSGPAYMYLVMEALADAGVRVGLRRDLALELVAQTMLGSARMVLDTGRHPASLRDDVTTPAGCTIGGLLMLEDGKIRSVLARAVEEATRIVEQLGKAAKAVT